MKRILGSGRSDVLALVTPEIVRDRGPLARILLGGVTLVGMASAAVIAASSLVSLMLALGVIYFLTTQVLGLKVNVDPQAFYQQFYRQAASAYGAN